MEWIDLISGDVISGLYCSNKTGRDNQVTDTLEVGTVALLSSACSHSKRAKMESLKILLFLLVVGIAWSQQFHVHRSKSAVPVKVEVFYESLCDDCIEYLSRELFKVWNETLPYGIMSLQLYPYGNAQQVQQSNGTWNFTCQHSQRECLGNTIEACIISRAAGDPLRYFPTIRCMEEEENPIAAAENCVNEKSEFDIQDIMTCAEGPEGNQLQHEFGLKTYSLQPKHQYVPWILIDGKHTEKLQKEAEADLLKLVCQLYEGKKPMICESRLLQDLEKMFDVISISIA